MTAYTLVHVVLSLVGIASGLVVLLGLLAGKRHNASTAVFLATTAATSLTGFMRDMGGIWPGSGEPCTSSAPSSPST
jgi:hypothetical protein